MNTRIIGIDLAVTAAHKAIVLDQASNSYVSPVFTFHTDPADLDHLLHTARAVASEPTRLQAVLEATAMSWYAVGQYLQRHNVEVYRVNGQQVIRRDWVEQSCEGRARNRRPGRSPRCPPLLAPSNRPLPPQSRRRRDPRAHHQ